MSEESLKQATSKKPTSWGIGELAREFDVTTRTIRFYEDEGLLQPRRRGQTRIYSSADRTTLKLILRGKRLGFSLAESRQLIQMYNPRSEEHTSELQSRPHLVCRLLLEKKKNIKK